MRNITILLIEDNPPDIRLIREMLKDVSNFKSNLISVLTLKEGCEQIQKNNFDIILLDLNLPDSTGQQTFQKVIDCNNEIPVVLITGMEDVKLSLKLILEGAQDYITKQRLNPDLLEKSILYSIERQALLRNIKIQNVQIDRIEKERILIAKFPSQDPDPILRVAGNGKLLYINEAGTKLLPDWQLIINEIIPSRLKDIIDPIFIEGTNIEFELCHREFIYSFYAVPLIEDGYINLYGRDITGRKKAEQELIFAKEKADESNRLKTAFLNNISHEIRTPFNGILGFLSIIQDIDLKGSERDEYISIVNKSAFRLINTINDIVEISQIQTGQLKPIASEVNIKRLTDDLFNKFKTDAECQGLEYTLNNDLPNDVEYISTDSTKLNTILSILIGNAIKFTKAGSIEFGIRKNGDNLEFSVKDTGIGIFENKQQAIFEQFMQADVSNTRQFEGAGLGLSIAKSYVEMLEGKIWVESDPEDISEGKGSTFFFTLPCNNERIEKMGTNEDVSEDIVLSPINPEVSGLKILIVEDDETSELFLRNAIKLFSKEILSARTGVKAVEACRNNPDVDLILMDIKMPVMNGYEATRQIRKFNKDVIIIAQTAYALVGDREKAIAEGCNDYISKPIKKDQLMAMVGKYFKIQEEEGR